MYVYIYIYISIDFSIYTAIRFIKSMYIAYMVHISSMYSMGIECN